MKVSSTFFLLPAVKDNRILEIKNISIEEATNFLDLHTTQLIGNSNIHVTDYVTGLKAELSFLHPVKFQVFFDKIDTNNIGYLPLYEQVLHKIKSLSKLSCHENKYRRAVYVDIDSNLIAFSKTVFGSKFGYINYNDASLDNELAGIQSYIDKYSYQDIL